MKKGKKSPKKKIKRTPWIRPAKFTIADKATLKRILEPPPKPSPEFQGQEYVIGINEETKFLYLCTEPNCTAKFTNQTGLNIHSARHLNKNIRCSFCNQIFKTEDELISHKKTFHPDLDKYPDANPLQCQKCLKVSRDAKALWRHVRESHRDMSYPCIHCAFPFTRPENLKEHLKTKHANLVDQPVQRFYCEYCPVSYIYKNSLRLHVRAKHRGTTKSYRCVICDTIYTNLICYRGHMRVHCDPKYIKCDICKKTFRNHYHLRRHQESFAHKRAARFFNKSHADANVPKIVAVKTAVNPNLTTEQLKELCVKTTARVSLHRVDERIMDQSTRKSSKLKKKKREVEETGKSKPEAPEGSYFCMYCSLKFAFLDSVNTHEKICLMKLRSKKVNMCPICDKEFDKPYSLRRHYRRHTSDRPFMCSFCPVMFKARGSKILHEKIVHFGIIPDYYNYKGRRFPCKEPGCGKVYSRPEYVRKHRQAIHLGMRYPCDKCSRVYKNKDNYRVHLKRDHAECPVRLECAPCGRTYKGKATYLFHLQTRRHFRLVKAAKRLKKEKATRDE